MSKIIHCKDLDIDCGFFAYAETDEDVLKKYSEHAQTMHGMKEIPIAIITKAHSVVWDFSLFPKQH
jgi:predicted small metal-binding protein